MAVVFCRAATLVLGRTLQLFRPLRIWIQTSVYGAKKDTVWSVLAVGHQTLVLAAVSVMPWKLDLQVPFSSLAGAVYSSFATAVHESPFAR